MGVRSRSKRAGQGRGGGSDSGGAGAGTDDPVRMSLQDFGDILIKSLGRPGGRLRPDGAPADDDSDGDLPVRISANFRFNGKRLSLLVPENLLSLSADYQKGYVYGALMQKIRPGIIECRGCGLKHIQSLALVKKDIYKEVPQSEGGD